MKNLKITLLFLFVFIAQTFSQTLTINSVLPGSSFSINGKATGVGIVAEEVDSLKLRIVDMNSGLSTLYTLTSLTDVTVDGANSTSISEAVRMINSVTSIVKFNENYFIQVSKGKIPGHSLVHKFGANEALNSTWQVVSSTGTYQTPTSPQVLELLSDNANDTSAGTGARKVIVQGLSSTFEFQTDTIVTNGTTAVALSNNYIRVFRMFVYTSGTYASIASGSHDGTITLQGTGGGVEWAQIDLIDTFPSGQSQIAAYTIPANYKGYVLSKSMTLESGKPVDITLFKRENADDTTAPYTGIMRIIEHNHGLESAYNFRPVTPLASLPEKTDIGFLARVTTTGTASVDFEILLIKNGY